MKKFFTFVAVALMGVSAFAAAPTKADLEGAGYDVQNDVIIAVSYPETITICGGLALVGNFNNYSGDAAKCILAEELEGFNGWYVFDVEKAIIDSLAGLDTPVTLEARPIVLDENGVFPSDWGSQPAGPDNIAVEAASDAPTITNGQYENESNIFYPAAGAYIYVVNALKGLAPCVPKVYHDYVISVYAPADCDGNNYQPALIGVNADWKNNVEMEMGFDAEGEVVYTAEIHAYEGGGYKFREATMTGDDWSNQIQAYNVDEDSWYDLADNKLGTEINITHDFRGVYHKWTLCEAQEPQGIKAVEAKAAAQKVLENGRVVILRNNVRYNVLGAQE